MRPLVTDWRIKCATIGYRLEDQMCHHWLQTGGSNVRPLVTDWRIKCATIGYRLEDQMCDHWLQT